MNMNKTEEIKLTLEQAKLSNMRVWDYLMKICVLLGSPIISQLEVELQEYIKQTQAASFAIQSPFGSMAQQDGCQIRDALVAEASVNTRLKQLVEMWRVQIQEMQDHGQPVPNCPTSWMYQDFPALSDLNQAKSQPLTTLLDHILDRYDLDKDEHFKKTVLSMEVASLWHRNLKLWRKQPFQTASVSKNSRPTQIHWATPGIVTVATHSTVDDAKDSSAPHNDKVDENPVTAFNDEYKRVVSGGVENGLVLRLVRLCSDVNRDLTSDGAIAAILRESVESGSQLEGAGFLVHRYRKIAKRRLKAAAETDTNRDSSQLFSLNNCGGEPSPCVANAVEPESKQESKRNTFLSNVAKFQNKFKGATNGIGHGQKRKTSDSSVCRGLQTKFSKARRDTTLSALKRHVTKRSTMNMNKTEEIKLTLEQAKLSNMRVWDYLMKICVLLGSPIISQLEVELQEYIKQTQAASFAIQSPFGSMAQQDGCQIRDALVAEASVNTRLKQLVEMWRVQIQEMQDHGQPVPNCPSSWMYQDFPALSELNQAKSQPLTTLLDHILDRYDLDKDEHFKKTVLSMEVASLWHRNLKLWRKQPLQPASVSNNSRPTKTNWATPGIIEDATHSTIDDAKVSSAPLNDKGVENPVTAFSDEYKRVVSGGVGDDLVLRLVRMCSGVNRDLTSGGAIAAILRESVESGSQLEGAGYLVHRYRKIAKRRLKAAAEIDTNRDSSYLFSLNNCGGEPSPCVANAVEPESKQESKRNTFLSNVAKFQNKFKGVTNLSYF